MEKSDHQLRVEDFMAKAGQDIPTKPIMPDYKTRLLRANLILEEVKEALKGLGFEIHEVDSGTFNNITSKIEVNPEQKYEPDLVEIIDGIADISVVSIGSAISCGINMNPILKMVDLNNLAKFGEGGYRNEIGKWVKPKGHLPPDIKGEIEKQLNS